MKNYNESMLESMSNGVITLDEDGRIVTCNAAGLRILQAKPAEILNRPAADFFTETNAWVVDKVRQVEETHTPDRSEEHTSELQSLMRISYAVFCLKKKKKDTKSVR